MYMLNLPSVSILLLTTRHTAKVQRRTFITARPNTNRMTFTMNPKRKSSSLEVTVISDHNNTDTTKSVFTDLQMKQNSLLSEKDDHNDSKKVSPLTPFQRKVYTALCLVPEGYVTTYQSIGKYIHCSSNQAIGQALKRNPYAPTIPCHRVIKSNGTIGGFQGHTSGESIAKKISLLQKEGVIFISTDSATDISVDPLSICDLNSETMKKQKRSNIATISE